MTLTCIVLLPVAWGFFVLLSLAWGIYVLSVRTRRSYVSFGKARSLGIEASATLVAIPLSGLVGSVGAGLAFYQLSKSTGKAREDGWDTLATAVAAALTINFGFVWLLVRHQSGADPPPFESDVDPRLGIRVLRELRTGRPRTFLSGQVLFAAERCNETIENGEVAKQPRLRDAIATLVKQPRDRTEILVVSLTACGWVAASFILGGKGWLILAYCLASLSSFVFAGGVGGLAKYYDQLRWAKRESTLYGELRRQAQEAGPSRREDRLFESIDALKEELEAVRTLLEANTDASVEKLRRLRKGRTLFAWLTCQRRR